MPHKPANKTAGLSALSDASCLLHSCSGQKVNLSLTALEIMISLAELWLVWPLEEALSASVEIDLEDQMSISIVSNLHAISVFKSQWQV